MKKILILTRFRGEYEPRRLAEEAVKLGYGVDKVNYEHVRIGVSKMGRPIVDLGTGRKLDEYDLIIPRAATKRGGESMLGVKSVILEYLEQTRSAEREIKVINGESFKFFPLMGKLEQGLLLAEAGLPVIPFVSFRGQRGWKRYSEILEKRKSEFVPVMVKARFGSHGKNVKLAETIVRLNKLALKYSEGDVLIQPVLKIRRWYRVLAQQEELSKIKPKFTKEQMAELEKLSVEAVKVLKANFAGLDVAWDEDSKQWRILEVNRTAQFKWFEKAFPEINVAGRMGSI